MSPPFDPQEQAGIEQFLLDELVSARAQYENSKQNFDLAVSQREDLGQNHPDGLVAVRQATRLNRRALNRYRVALREFNRFVLARQIPDYLKRK